MKNFIFIFIILISNYNYGQTLNNVNNQIDTFILLFNNLPKTNITGKENFEYQSKYSIKWNVKRGNVTIEETRFIPNSNEDAPDSYEYSFNINSLHKNGIFVKSLYDSTACNLLIFTAKNSNKIRAKVNADNKQKFVSFNDRFQLGSWDKAEYFEQLNELQKILISIVNNYNNWSDEQKPDLKKKMNPYFYDLSGIGNLSVDFKFDHGSPVFINSTIDQPALFNNSESEKGNQKIIKKYLKKEFKNNKISLSDKIIGSIIISNTGQVEDFLSLSYIETDIESKIKGIILKMPKWKAGVHENEYVRTSQNFEIK